MNIVFTRFPLESAHGGAEVQTMSLMKGLRERGHAVTFIGSCPVLIELCKKAGIPFSRMEIGPPPVTKWGVISFFWRQQGMRDKLEEIFDLVPHVDAICMLSLSEKILLTGEADRRGIRVHWIEHDRIGPWLTQNPWLKTLKHRSRCVMTICVSELSRQMYVKLGWNPERTVAIGNGVDMSRLLRKPGSGIRDPGSGFTIGCLARLTHDKGVDLLIDAVKDLPDVNLTIVGQGREETTIKTKLKQIHEYTNTRIDLFPKMDDLPAFYHSLDLLVLPSREHDPFGLVATEAMLCGVPVIVTDKCGIAGYLKDGKDALIVQAGSADALRTAIKKMVDDSAMRESIARQGQSTAQQKFTLDRMVENYEMIMKKQGLPK